MDVLPVQYLTHKGGLINASVNHTTQSEAWVSHSVASFRGVALPLLIQNHDVSVCQGGCWTQRKCLLTPVLNEGSLSICFHYRDYRHIIWFEEAAHEKKTADTEAKVAAFQEESQELNGAPHHPFPKQCCSRQACGLLNSAFWGTANYQELACCGM